MVEPLRLPTVEWFDLCRTDSFNGRIIASDDGRMSRGKKELEETHSFLLSSYLDSASPLSSLNSVDAVTTTLPSFPLLLLFLPSVEQGGGEG